VELFGLKGKAAVVTGVAALFMAPGLSYALTQDPRIYGFAQPPLAQHVNGVQLTARRGAVVGVSTKF
jgi:hypothetical protein